MAQFEAAGAGGAAVAVEAAGRLSGCELHNSATGDVCACVCVVCAGMQCICICARAPLQHLACARLHGCKCCYGLSRDQGGFGLGCMSKSSMVPSTSGAVAG